MMVLAKSILTWNMKSIDIVILQISKQKTGHQVRRPSHLQTHRGSALEERGRQSWAEVDLAKILDFFVFVHQNLLRPKIYQEDRALCGMLTMKTSSKMSSWNPGPPPRRVNLLLQVILSSWNYPLPCRGAPLDKVAFVYQGNHSRLTHDTSYLSI